MEFEKKEETPLTVKEYVSRQIKYALISMGLLAISLLIGVLGYHFFCGLEWIDSLLNASMILTGMGPINPMETDGAKLFASFYSIYSGVAFLGISAVFIAPLAHRILHLFHAEN